MTTVRQFIRALKPRQEVARPTALGLEEQTLLPSLTEYTDHIRSSKRIEIYGPTPEFRFIESDQTDPVGQFRFQGTTGSFYLYKALTASWATQEIILGHDVTNKITYLNAITAADWTLRLSGGDITDDGGRIDLYNGGVILASGNGAGSTLTRLQALGNAVTPDMDFTNCRPDFNGLNLVGVGTLRGQGSQALYLRGWRETTDSTAQRVIIDVLNAATDTVYQVAAAVPNATTPLWTMLAPNVVPTTSQVDATHLSLTVDGTLQLIANFNSAGAMKTLVLGTLA